MQLIIGSRALSILYSFLLKYKEAGNYTLLLPSNICYDVFFLVRYLEISFVIVDTDMSNFCIDREITIDLIKKNRRSILVFNHTYGIPEVPYDFFRELRNISSEIVIIDDRCLCMPIMKTNSDDSCIDLILYSTGYAKQVDLSRWGFGFVNNPFCMTRHQITFEKQKYSELKNSFYDHLFNYLPDRGYLSECVQISDKIDDDIELPDYETLISEDVEKWQEHKRKITEIYNSELPYQIQLPSEMNSWRFNIIVNNRDKIINQLFRNNLFASAHYASIGTILNGQSCPNADHLNQKIINLFKDKYYTEEKAKKTVDIIRKNLV